MNLLSIRQINLAFGGPTLLSDISLQVNKGERICLLGRNGAGKSSLLRLLAGKLTPDQGVIDRRQGLRVTDLPQDLPLDLTGRVADVVAAGLAEVNQASPASQDGDWTGQQRIAQVLSRLNLDGEAETATLSGGLKRKVLLARALVSEPDILLLDEPTNHLDITTINWLEDFLKRSEMTLVFVTHDRAFLRALATRIVEIDRGKLFDFACDYDTFLQRKEELLHNEYEEWRRFDKKLAEEEIWIRKGIKARRTRNEGRVRALLKMRDAFSERRQRQGKVRLNLQDAERSGKLVAQVENISFAYDQQPLVRNFSTTVLRDRTVSAKPPCSSCCSANSPLSRDTSSLAPSFSSCTLTSFVSNLTRTKPCNRTCPATRIRS